MEYNIQALRGKVIFVNFWASWCPPCRAEFPSIRELQLKFRNRPELAFVMINEDAQLANGSAFLRKGEYPFFLYQAKGTIPATIFSGSLPTTIVLDKKGHVRLRHEGFANYASAKFIKQIGELINE